MNPADYVKGECTGLFVSSIKFLPQSALLEAPHTYSSALPPFHFNSRTFKVRQTGPFVSSCRGPRDSVRQQAPCLTKFLDFPKVLDGYMRLLTPGKACAWWGGGRELGRHGKGREGGRAPRQGLCGGLTEPEEPGVAPRSPRPALLSGPQWHSGLLARSHVQRVSPQIPNFSLPGYFRLVLNKRSRFKKKCCYNTQPEAFSPAVSVTRMRSV